MSIATNVNRTICFAILVIAGLAIPANVNAQVVRFNSNVGSFDVQLFEDATPQTVANFLFYLNNGDYTNSLVHRLDSDFVLQGGGFFPDGSAITTAPPVINEPGISNTRGTIALARQSGDPNSGTSQFFFNLEDNLFLDSVDEGFTVFGEVLGDGLDVLDEISELSIVDANGGVPGPFGELPVFDVNAPLTVDNLVIFESVVVVPEPSSLALLLVSGTLLACR